MTKRRTPWRQTTQVCLRVHFETHPDVHTFIHHAETGDICTLLRDLLRAHIQQTGHPAGDQATQKAAAMAGMSHLIDQTISAARLGSPGTPAAGQPTAASPPARAAQTPAAQPAAAAATPVPTVPLALEAIQVAAPEVASREESPAVQMQAIPQTQVIPAEALAANAPLPLVKKPGIVGRFDDD